MQESFLLAGFGGQGVMFAGQLLAYAAMDSGYEVTWIPSYGPEMRGGTAHCTVVISDKPIGSPIVSHPCIVVAFNNPSFEKYEALVQSDGLLAYNASLINQSSKRRDIDVLAVHASEEADRLGNMKLMNMVMLGAVLAARPVLSQNAMRRALENHLPVHHRNLLDLNFSALEAGASLI
jgi:2-oxoglutarate ferredoxin oxidoreductase subunit gamma